MIRSAIIGCGKQADQHAVLLDMMPDCEIVGFCDREELMARQMAERFKVARSFTDAAEMLAAVKPDVVHINTPPQAHLRLGTQCFEAGCHVFFEKPFTMNAVEAQEVIDLASEKGLKLTVGHNNQFSPVALKMRELVREGFLGGPPVHMESLWCYDMGDPRFAKALLGNRAHWIRKLPGKLLQNIISHGVSKLAEFIESESPAVLAHGFTSPLLKGIGEDDIIDELRVIISDGEDRTAYFTFSSQIQPRSQQFRIYGPRNSLVLYDLEQMLVKRPRQYKSFLNTFCPPFVYARQYRRSGFANIWRFLRRRAHFDAGRRVLFNKFYDSVQRGTPVPIPYKEIIVTARIMDAVFEQLSGSPSPQREAARVSSLDTPGA